MDSGGGKITLDQESFKALASDVRVGILKRLDVRRETVTDLSGLLNLSKPTLLEHLEKLQAAGLVKRIDEGRKWIYYALSDKGRKILHPERVAITLALAVAVVLAGIGVFYVLFASGALTPGAPLLNASAPSAQRDALSEPETRGLIAFVSSAAFLVAAVGLRFFGERRRERFFAELSVA